MLIPWIVITTILPSLINCAPACCMLCCDNNNSKDLPASNPSDSGTVLKPSGPNLRPTVYPPSRVEYCDDPEDDNAQDQLSTGAISGARSPFSSMFRGKRRKPRKPKPGSGQDKGKPPPPVEGGKGKGWGKADTMFDGVSAGTGVINLGMDLAGGDSEEGGEGKED
uniref:(northern house mosquito) hypothetical protein n=1 Tax=Culex pipiens TaxID=7175 RepID=A0A8D8BR13_CULPI